MYSSNLDSHLAETALKCPLSGYFNCSSILFWIYTSFSYLLAKTLELSKVLAVVTESAPDSFAFIF